MVAVAVAGVASGATLQGPRAVAGVAVGATLQGSSAVAGVAVGATLEGPRAVAGVAVGATLQGPSAVVGAPSRGAPDASVVGAGAVGRAPTGGGSTSQRPRSEVDPGHPLPTAAASPMPPGLGLLAVPGHLAAALHVPTELSRPRPVVVVAHGASDRPEPQCEAWARVFGDRAFVLCPRGTKVASAPTTYEFTGVYALRREAEAGLAALAARAGEHVDVTEPVFVGFSLGALLGVHLLADGHLGARRAILVEGGADRFTSAHLTRLSTQGFVGVLFACGETACPRVSQPAAEALRARGIEARVVVAKGSAHTYGPPMLEAVRSGIGALLEGDPRFSP